MAIQKRELQYVIDGYVNSGFYKTLTNVNKSLSRTKNVLSGMNSIQAQSAAASRKAGNGISMFGSGLLKTAIGAVGAYVGIQQLTLGYKECVAKAEDSITTTTRLQTLMMNHKGTTLADVKAVQALATAQSKLTTLSGKTISSGQSELASFQMSAKAIRDLTPTLTNMAVGQFGLNVSQEQAQASAKLIGKAFAGNATALQRFGIKATKAQQNTLKMGTESQKTAVIIDLIRKKYGNVAQAMAKTPQGRVIMLNNAWARIQKTIGLKLLPIQEKVTQFVTSHLPQIESLINKVTSAISPTLNMVMKIGAFFVRNWKWIVPVIMGIIAAFGALKVALAILTVQQMIANAAMAANPIGMIVLAVGLLIGGIAALIMNWKKVVGALKHAWTWFIKFGTEGPGRFIPIVNIVALVAKSWDKITDAVKRAWNWVKTFIQKVRENPIVQMGVRTVGAVSKAVAGKRANGGPVSFGRSYLVGEHGPELFTPRRNGSIIPNLSLAGGGGSNITVNFSYNAAPGSGSQDARNAVDYLMLKLRKMEQDRRRRSFHD